MSLKRANEVFITYICRQDFDIWGTYAICLMLVDILKN